MFLKKNHSSLILNQKLNLFFSSHFFFHLQFRESQAKIEELDTENYHLQNRIDKLSKSKISSNNFD